MALPDNGGDQQVRLLPTQVCDRAAKSVVTAARQHRYGTLVLATGSTHSSAIARRPACVYHLLTISTLSAPAPAHPGLEVTPMAGWLSVAATAGLEAANALRRIRVTGTSSKMMPRLMAQQIDEAGSTLPQPGDRIAVRRDRTESIGGEAFRMARCGRGFA